MGTRRRVTLRAKPGSPLVPRVLEGFTDGRLRGVCVLPPGQVVANIDRWRRDYPELQDVPWDDGLTMGEYYARARARYAAAAVKATKSAE